MAKILLLSLIAALSFYPTVAAASVWDMLEQLKNELNATTTIVTTSINASANTGGNVAEPGGEIVTGDRTVTVEVQNTVDGEVIDPIEIQITPTSTAGTQHIEQITDTTRTQVTVTIDQADPEKTTADSLTPESNTNPAEESAKPASENPGVLVSIIISIKNFFSGLLNSLFN